MKQRLGLCFAVLSSLVSQAVGQFDLCVFFGTCNNNNNNNRNIQNNNFNARSDPGPEFVQIDSNWIEPKNSGGNAFYHFGTGLGNTDWYSADSYCSERGGYLAEPSSIDEHNFIVSYARFVVFYKLHKNYGREIRWYWLYSLATLYLCPITRKWPGCNSVSSLESIIDIQAHATCTRSSQELFGFNVA